MTARRLVALALFAAAAGLAWIALLTPLRADEIAALDAEAERLGVAWAEAGDGQVDGGDEQDRLLRESNAAYSAARALEPPLDPLRAGGFALLAIAGGVALWPAPRTEEGAGAPTGHDPER